ncbi:Crp/Fnr family transcriptional regulator [Thaumasiovibrio subtropicus]|uniref:Crp/Fnr family transcriptional regulator n=1 Tax=Thaumasiovibrio subtropicus TaxID=1891207 RepID=UPI00131D946A|nr:Crp/Fnr family transcriptional regulator [Thaumasiovibrio subtropicus]
MSQNINLKWNGGSFSVMVALIEVTGPAMIPDALHCHPMNVAKKQVIYRATQHANGFYYLEEGLVGLYRITETGKESLLRVYGRGDYFGYRSLFSQQRYHLTTRTLLPTSLQHIHLKSIDELQQHAPDLLKFLMTSVCQELGEAEQRMADIAGHSAAVRIVDAILYLFKQFDYYPWTSREIAEFSGTETQTVIRVCRQLKQRELLDPNSRKISPLDFNRLQSYRVALIGETR